MILILLVVLAVGLSIASAAMVISRRRNGRIYFLGRIALLCCAATIIFAVLALGSHA